MGISGCGSKGKPATSDSLSFESLPDSTAIASGVPLLSQFEPYRASDGSLRLRGRLNLPDSARIQITLKHPGENQPLIVTQTLVLAGGFDTAPVYVHGGNPPADNYVFEISSQFNRVWQPQQVLAATHNGLDLRGPGMRRGDHGEAVFRITLEKHL